MRCESGHCLHLGDRKVNDIDGRQLSFEVQEWKENRGGKERKFLNFLQQKF